MDHGPSVEGRFGRYHGEVRWNSLLNTYSCVVDVVGSGIDSVSGGGSIWPFLIEGKPFPDVAAAILGDRFAEHVTIDSLRNELVLHDLAPDPGSWKKMQSLPSDVREKCGESFFVCDLATVTPEPYSSYSRDEWQADSRYELCLVTSSGVRVSLLGRRVAPGHRLSAWESGQSLLDVSRLMVDVAWSRRRGACEEATSLELSLELLPNKRSFVVSVESIADWVSHGVKPDLLDVDGLGVGWPRRGRTFNQLAIEFAEMAVS